MLREWIFLEEGIEIEIHIKVHVVVEAKVEDVRGGCAGDATTTDGCGRRYRDGGFLSGSTHSNRWAGDTFGTSPHAAAAAVAAVVRVLTLAPKLLVTTSIAGVTQ